MAKQQLRIFDPFFPESLESELRNFFRPTRWASELEVPQIRIDVDEEPNAYIVQADIPGVRKEDISVQVAGNLLRIDAEVKQEREVKDNGRSLRKERYYGAVSRTIALTSDLDDARTEAKYENGVLKLRLPKKDAAATKRITVS